jgi:3',5'-cyclic AMP phosphodiesterase CpdA
MNKHLLYLLIIFLSATGCCNRKPGAGTTPEHKLSFAFLTDIHQNAGNTNDRRNGFIQAIETVRQTGSQFIITGGDMVDVSGIGSKLSKEQADSLYAANKKILDDSGLPYYPAIGNHDRYFDHEAGFDAGDELFKAFFSRSYYTFEAEGIKFFILNSVQFDVDNNYTVGAGQMEWLTAELAETPAEQPLVVSLHVPVYSLYYPVVEGKFSDRDVISNFAEVRDKFKGHNLKLVLQGHQHVYEEIFSQNVQYITAGAVSAAWWRGQLHGTEEGFLLVHVDSDNKFTWEYIDIGWEAK